MPVPRGCLRPLMAMCTCKPGRDAGAAHEWAGHRARLFERNFVVLAPSAPLGHCGQLRSLGNCCCGGFFGRIGVCEFSIGGPENRFEVSGGGVGASGSAIRASGNAIRVSGSRIRVPGNAIRASRNGSRVPGGRIGVSGNAIGASGSLIGVPGNRIWSRGGWVEDFGRNLYIGSIITLHPLFPFSDA